MRCELFAGPEEAIRWFAKDYDLDALPKLANLGLEKSWHGLHFALTGEAWGGTAPLNFLIEGGSISDDDQDAPRLFDPNSVIGINAAIQAIGDAEFGRRFNVHDLEEHEIYPNIWDEDPAELLEEYMNYFHSLKQFVAQAAHDGHWLLVSVG